MGRRYYSSLTEYSLTHEFKESCSINETYFRTIAEEFDIDLDKVYDVCEEKRIPFMENAIRYIDELYNRSNPYIKTKIFYKFMQSFNIDFLNLCVKLSQSVVDSIGELRELCIEEEPDYTRIEILMEGFLNHYDNNRAFDITGSNTFDYTNVTVETIIKYTSKFIEAYKKLSKNVFFKFNDIISNEYYLEYQKCNKIFNDFLEDSQDELNSPDKSVAYITVGPGVTNVTIIKNEDSILGFDEFTNIETEEQKTNRMAMNLLSDPVVSIRLNNTSGTSCTTRNVMYTSPMNNLNTGTYCGLINDSFGPSISATSGSNVKIVSNKTLINDKLNTLKRTAEKYKDAVIMVKNRHLNEDLKKELKRFIDSTPLPTIYPVGFKRFKKSLKTLYKFVSQEQISNLIFPTKEYELDSCRGMIIEGELFNWEIKVSQNSCIKYSEKMDSYSINYKFWVLTKENERIARLCIVYKDSPILDQVLSNVLNIKTGNEHYILKNSGIFDRGPLYKLFLEQYCERIGEPNLDNFDSVRRLFHNTKLMTQEFRVKISSMIRQSSLNIIREHVPPAYLDYSMGVDVSWEEAKDYVAFNLFDIGVFDSLVKPLLWSPINPKQLFAGPKYVPALKWE